MYVSDLTSPFHKWISLHIFYSKVLKKNVLDKIINHIPVLKYFKNKDDVQQPQITQN